MQVESSTRAVHQAQDQVQRSLLCLQTAALGAGMLSPAQGDVVHPMKILPSWV